MVLSEWESQTWKGNFPGNRQSLESLLLCANESIGGRVQQAREAHAQQPCLKHAWPWSLYREKLYPIFIKKGRKDTLGQQPQEGLSSSIKENKAAISFASHLFFYWRMAEINWKLQLGKTWIYRIFKPPQLSTCSCDGSCAITTRAKLQLPYMLEFPSFG